LAHLTPLEDLFQLNLFVAEKQYDTPTRLLCHTYEKEMLAPQTSC
jgi:hypothetical protein